MLFLLDQLRFTLELALASDLHIGTGETARLGEWLSGNEAQGGDDADAPEVALIARNLAGQPILPATAVKSALRRALPAEANRLFGSIKNTVWRSVSGVDEPWDSGQWGVVWLRTATLKSAPQHPGELPYWNQGAISHRHSYIATHVAINRKTRTADDQKLFNVERVPEGATFELAGVVFGKIELATADLDRVLKTLVTGINLGADERFGSGRIKLSTGSSAVTIVRHYFDAKTGTIESHALLNARPSANKRPALPEHRQFTLTCPGPYTSLDHSKAQRRSNTNVRRAARRSTDLPALAPQSLIGALRTRCAWLSHFTHDGYNPNTVGAGDQLDKIVSSTTDVGALSATERLFGLNGWRGLVRIVEMTCKGGTLCDGIDGRAPAYTSVSLDRFSQAPMDGALYTTEFFLNSTFAVTVTLDQRSAFPTPSDMALFAALLADIETHGLMLGHGTNKGFGWFDVSKGAAS